MPVHAQALVYKGDCIAPNLMPEGRLGAVWWDYLLSTSSSWWQILAG
jgi:hypothetical protein